jgi:hypothetical protein
MNRTPSMRSGLATALATLALIGCGGHNTGPGIVPNEPTTVRVENQRFNDMRIYVYQSSQRIRLGTAGGLSTATFKIPKSVMAGITTLRFQAVPIGGVGSAVSEEITVNPGEELVLRITPG